MTIMNRVHWEMIQPRKMKKLRKPSPIDFRLMIWLILESIINSQCIH